MVWDCRARQASLEWFGLQEKQKLEVSGFKYIHDTNMEDYAQHIEQESTQLFNISLCSCSTETCDDKTWQKSWKEEVSPSAASGGDESLKATDLSKRKLLVRLCVCVRVCVCVVLPLLDGLRPFGFSETLHTNILFDVQKTKLDGGKYSPRCQWGYNKMSSALLEN